jgi:hypothetical protein
MRVIIALALLMIPLSADARLTMGVLSSANSGGGGVGPSCNNSLDFTQACNSVYIGVVQ